MQKKDLVSNGQIESHTEMTKKSSPFTPDINIPIVNLVNTVDRNTFLFFFH